MKKVFLAVVLQLSAALAFAERFYVSDDAPEGGDGSSWGSAFQHLQDALDQTVASRGDEVWIEAGIYYPDDGSNVTEGDREASFTLVDGVTLYGGFAGVEMSQDERNLEANISILSGEINADQEFWSLHVCIAIGNVGLYNLTVTKGNANGLGQLGNGGGVYSANSTIEAFECSFSDNSAINYGGVAYLGNWTVTGSTFSNNSAYDGGVAHSVNWIVKDSTFSGNSADNYGGVARGSWTVTDSFFIGNTANRGGVATGNWTVTGGTFIGNAANRGGVAYLGDWTVTGSTFSGNLADDGGVASDGYWIVSDSSFSGNLANRGGIRFGGALDLYNSIVSGSDLFSLMTGFTNRKTTGFPTPNPPRAKNIIEGGEAAILMSEGKVADIGTGFIINADPLFVNSSDPDGPDNVWGTADDGLRLQASSPAIGQGNLDFLPLDVNDLDNDGDTAEPLPLDFAGFVRVQGGTLDLGAYEFGNLKEIPFALTTTVSPLNSGSVAESGDGSYTDGATATLTPSPSLGYLFDSWSGDASGSNNPLALLMDADKAVTAFFIQDSSDTDNDGLSRYDELVTYGTNPSKPDSDGDGIKDGDEIGTIFNPNTDDTATLQLLAANPQLYLDLAAPELSQLLSFDELVIQENESGDFVVTIQLLTSEDLITWIALDLSGAVIDGDRIKLVIPVSGSAEFLRLRGEK